MSTAERGWFSLLTPPGEGGIAVFAVGGPGAREALCRAVRSRRLAALRPGELAYGELLDAAGAVLDEVIVAALAPSSSSSQPPTGNSQPATAVARFELNCHAGGAAAAAAAGRLRDLGLEERPEPADEPGLAPDEAWFRRALAAVKTRRQLEALCRWRAQAGDDIKGGSWFLVPGSSFPVGEDQGPGTRNQEPRTKVLLERLLATHRVVLAGPVNAGKSTLFNRLAGDDRAIVSPHPGTTRDAVVAEVSVRGLAVELVDTAGLGAVAGDSLATEAQDLARREAAGADLVILVLDGSEPPDDRVRAEIEALRRAARRALVAVNKCDRTNVWGRGPRDGGRGEGLSPEIQAPNPGSQFHAPRPSTLAPMAAVKFSALTGAGLDALAVEIERALLGECEGPGGEAGGAY